MRGWWILVLIWLPVAAEASVSLSEVAWMGTSESANHEWIELYNDGVAVNVDGWRLHDGNNFSIELSGTIPASSYQVLERTSDESAPGNAFLIYTGALVNTGATLRLERADGSLVDQVSGGEDWEKIGGDNVTKETAQYTEAGWITAAATPGAPPPKAAERQADEDDSENDFTNTKLSKGTETTTKPSVRSNETVRLTLPEVTLQLAVEAQTVGYVNQPISFTVTPSGIGDSLQDSLRFEWNFGDGSTAITKTVTHVFSYPGTYVVTVYGGFKRQEQVARHEITILPVALSLTSNVAGDVQVNNDSPYELDISGYRVKGEREFVFPARSIVLPNQTITLAAEQVGSNSDIMVAVYDTEAALVASRLPVWLQDKVSEERLAVAAADTVPPAPVLPVAAAKQESSNLFGFSTEGEVENDKAEFEAGDVSEAAVIPITAMQSASVINATSTPTERPVAYVALAGMLAVGVLGLLAKPRRNEVS